MSVYINIKNKVKSNVQACILVDKVYGYERMNPEGFPCVMITGGAIDGEFASTSENSRVYSFRLLILFSIGSDYPNPPQNMEREEYADNVIYSVIDQIVDKMDVDFELSNSDPTVKFVNASDALPGYYKYEGGEARGAEITLNVYTEKTVV